MPDRRPLRHRVDEVTKGTGKALELEAGISETGWDAASAGDGECRVGAHLLGPLFGYRGSFTVTEYSCTETDIPIDVRPLREEERE